VLDAMLGLPDPVTAIFATNPMTTLGIMRRAQERGILVPRDLSLVGVDDSDVRLHVWPRLSAVTQDASALGLEAAHWLTTMIARGDRDAVCRRTIATSFEVNGTTAPLAAKGGRMVGPRMLRDDQVKEMAQEVEA
jgi:DNA-binding LacI/PurR family transcriptional regulator